MISSECPISNHVCRRCDSRKRCTCMLNCRFNRQLIDPKRGSLGKFESLQVEHSARLLLETTPLPAPISDYEAYFTPHKRSPHTTNRGAEMRPSDARMQCSCSYKCRHGSDGYAWVCQRTWHNHQRLSATGKVHSCIRRSLEGQRATQQIGTTQRPQGARYSICTCEICGGRECRSRNTVAKHLRQQLVRGRLHNLAPCLLRNPSVAEEDGRLISHEGLVEPMENIREGEGQSDNANVQGNGQVGLVEANGCTGENEENAIREKLVTIDEAILTHTIEL